MQPKVLEKGKYHGFTQHQPSYMTKTLAAIASETQNVFLHSVISFMFI